MKSKNSIYRILAALVIVSALSVEIAWGGSPRILDHIDVKYGEDANEIIITFQVPVRVVTYLANRANNEVRISVLPVITPGTEVDFVGGDETLSWRPTQEVPLDKIIFSGRLIGNSTALLSFTVPIGSFDIRQGKDISSIKMILHKERNNENESVE